MTGLFDAYTQAHTPKETAAGYHSAAVLACIAHVRVHLPATRVEEMSGKCDRTMTKTELHAIIVELNEQKKEAEQRESVLQGENIVLRSRLLQLSQDYQSLLDKIRQHKVVN